jgi:hypothetical protein
VEGTGINAAFTFLNQPQFQSYNNLIFFAAFGNTQYNTSVRPTWFAFSQQVVSPLGGTPQVFFLVNNPNQPTQFVDDYTLVGGPIDDTSHVIYYYRGQYELYHFYPTGLEGEVGAELSSVIARETEAMAQPSLIEGLLEMDHEGYYGAKQFGHNVGMTSDTIARLVNASVQPPVLWPSGPNAQASQNAYKWISQQICCADMRAAYVNLNIDPASWLTQLEQLSYSAKVPNSDEEDFNYMKTQLATELQYVAGVRRFENNLLGLYQAQQANYGLLLQEAQDNVLANIGKIALTDPVPSQSLSSQLQNAFGILSTYMGLIPAPGGTGAAAINGIKTALALGSFILKESASHTNSPQGLALRAQEAALVHASDLAGQAAGEFAQTLISAGNQFDRIVGDWGRLQIFGKALTKDLLPWDSNAAGYALRGFDLLTRRDLYEKLIGASNVAEIEIYQYTQDQSYPGNGTWNGDICGFEGAYPLGDNAAYWQLASWPILQYPVQNPTSNVDPNDPHGTSYPYDYAWGTWLLIWDFARGEACQVNQTQTGQTPDPTVWGLFEPLDPGNPKALGEYRFWFFTRRGLPYFFNRSGMQPCYDVGGCG